MTDLLDLLDDDAPAPRRQVHTVSSLTAAIRDALAERFAEVWVEGELSNCRLWNSTGHLYFSLKDAGAQLKGIMFRTQVRLLRFKPEDGLHVVIRGRIGVYEPKGDYQIIGEHMEPLGLGALQLAFEQLKKKLAAEGLFAAERKRPLPALPRRIGIVTSLDGAALRDIIKVLGRRHPNLPLVIRPTRVQGEGAAAEIARALADIVRVPDVDVVIVGRGGGSIEDLWAFNEEVVARAIAASPVPVISAVGHETDTTVADFVADLRAPTPSAAAELVVARKDEFAQRIDRLSQRLAAASLARIQRSRTRVHQLTTRGALADVPLRVANRGRELADLSHALRVGVGARLATARRRMDLAGRRLAAVDIRHRFAHFRARLTAADTRRAGVVRRQVDLRRARWREGVGRLESLSPLAVLARGYAVCWTADRHRALRQARDVAPGAQVQVTLHEGELSCRVEAVRENGSERS